MRGKESNKDSPQFIFLCGRRHRPLRLKNNRTPSQCAHNRQTIENSGSGERRSRGSGETTVLAGAERQQPPHSFSKKHFFRLVSERARKIFRYQNRRQPARRAPCENLLPARSKKARKAGENPDDDGNERETNLIYNSQRVFSIRFFDAGTLAPGAHRSEFLRRHGEITIGQSCSRETGMS